MSSFEFWELMHQHGHMSRLWWYTQGAIPAIMIAVAAYLMMAFALRSRENPPLVFFRLLLATLPVLLILPSCYVSVSFDQALKYASIEAPQTALLSNPALAPAVGALLDSAAILGAIGATLALILAVLAAWFGHMPLITTLTSEVRRTVTNAVTNVTNPRHTRVKHTHGVLKVIQGSREGSEFAVRDGTIGRENAEFLITDADVSRRHARLEIVDDLVKLRDERSTNGTYIRRSDQMIELNGTFLDLRHGDTIYLGPPAKSTTAVLVYERREE